MCLCANEGITNSPGFMNPLSRNIIEIWPGVKSAWLERYAESDGNLLRSWTWSSRVQSTIRFRRFRVKLLRSRDAVQFIILYSCSTVYLPAVQFISLPYSLFPFSVVSKTMSWVSCIQGKLGEWVQVKRDFLEN